MQLFYNSSLSKHDLGFTFDREESKHIVKVLRKSDGDKLFVTNGIGDLFTTEVVLASENKCQVKIVNVEHFERRKQYLHLAVAPTKMNDRYEWFLEKATEIGVDEITPIICDHSERKNIKLERFQKIVQSASKQSLQYYSPIVNEAILLKDFLKQKHTGQIFIAHCEDGKKNTLKESIKPDGKIVILIGPEGDFSPNEIKISLENGFMPVSLGQTRLRTETAAIVACTCVAFCNE
ncbi:16S rRNA (uracil(1498)-N(3))-methyltransferase [Flavobacterium ardleyense]|uniref:16S rRNA (uracil(1498)-N(3))-methyltransferase n=1 Tax=Flavobacterium ardleyense TaxID=2038737 RepID=UPI00298CFC56|nr:16S rRNA (uracil(1498)-N(3))-methyltransferase [Flavobacterium ardleyense]